MSYRRTNEPSGLEVEPSTAGATGAGDHGIKVVPIAATLGLSCPDCAGQLEDRVGPFWCPRCQKGVSAWAILALSVKAAHGIEMFKEAEEGNGIKSAH